MFKQVLKEYLTIALLKRNLLPPFHVSMQDKRCRLRYIVFQDALLTASENNTIDPEGDYLASFDPLNPLEFKNLCETFLAEEVSWPTFIAFLSCIGDIAAHLVETKKQEVVPVLIQTCSQAKQASQLDQLLAEKKQILDEHFPR